jgi:uncharacterized membrane protein
MKLKGHTADIVNHTFQILLVTYLILLLLEQVWPGLVSVYLSLNWLLVLVILAGVLDVFVDHEPKNERVKKIDYIFAVVLGILGFGIILYKTGDLGWLKWVISIVAGILIILLSMLVLEENDEK